MAAYLFFLLPPAAIAVYFIKPLANIKDYTYAWNIGSQARSWSWMTATKIYFLIQNSAPCVNPLRHQMLINAFSIWAVIKRTWIENIATLARAGQIGRVEIETTQLGQRIWFNIVAQPVPGFKDYVHWWMEDITDQHNVTRFWKREKLSSIIRTMHLSDFSRLMKTENLYLWTQPFLAGSAIATKNYCQPSGFMTFWYLSTEKAAAYDIKTGGGVSAKW